MKTIKYVVLATLLALLYGCASSPALEGQGGLKLEENSMAILVLRISNEHKPKYTPKPTQLYLKAIDLADGEKGGGLLIPGIPKEPIKKESGEGRGYEEYLVGMSVKPGTYQIQNIMVTSNKFPIISSGVIPMNTRFSIEQGAVSYLGSVEVLRRKREEGDFMAGSPIPLIDQSVGGYSNGTFDVEVVDRYDGDIALFREKYASLENHEISRSLMSAWQRPGKKPGQSSESGKK